MKKYRIKINNNRIVGPLTREQLGELYIKGKILGSEECQYFPAGEWKTLKDFKELSRMFLSIIDKKIAIDDLKKGGESKTVVNLSLDSIKEKDSIKSEVQEFQFSKEKKPGSPKKEKVEETIVVANVEQEKDEDNLNSTVINADAKALLEKELEEKKKAEEEEKRREEEKKRVEEEDERNRIKPDERTQFISADALNESGEEISQEEIDEVERELIEHEKLSEFADESEESSDKIEEEDEGNKANKKRKRLIYGVVIAAVAIVLFGPEESKKKKGPIYSKIVFPVAQEYENSSKSIELYRKGVEAYKKNTYRARLVAAKNFRMSLSHKFSGNKALGNLILTYAEILNDTKNKASASKVIFDLIKLARAKALNEIDVAMGIAVFYSNLNKHKTAQYSLENYLRVSKKPSARFYAYYLKILSDSDVDDKAEKAFKTLCKGDRLPIEGFLYCAQYLKKKEKYADALNFVAVGLEKFPNSVPLLLEKGFIAFESENNEMIVPILKKIKAVSAENSPVYYSRYLELAGIVQAMSGDTEKAILYFQKALKIYDSETLRSKLASIESSDSEALVKESKSYSEMANARRELKKRNYDEAMRYAINAVDLSPINKDARLLLARVQIEMGYVSDAIKGLIELQGENSTDTEINYQLINAYIEAERLDEAIKQILTVKNSNFNKTAQYASLLARYYAKKKNYPLAMNWFHKSITRDPLNDRNYFYLSELHLRVKRYKESKLQLYKAMELEPENIEYISMNGKIIYEIDGVDTAIGYVRRKLEQFPENAKLMGDIAKYYYRSGMLKEFEEYKQKIEARVDVDEEYYRFMVDAAVLEDRQEDVVKYSERLIALSPGDVDSKMFLAEYYIRNNKVDKAMKILEDVNDQLPTFPRLHYLLAKCYMIQKQYPKMLEEGELEYKGNPNMEYGYYIAGEAYKLMKKYPESVKQLEKAVSINGQSVETLVALAWIKHKQNYLQEARELYMRALREEPGHAIANRELGYVYKSIGQSTLAIESLKLYLDLLPRAKDKQQVEAVIKSLQ